MYGNALTGADLSGAPNTNNVDLSDNSLDQDNVDSVLITLAGHSVSGGSVDLTTNAVPSASGTAAAGVLSGRGWTVNVDS